MTAGAMTAANILVNWLDRNSSSLVQDYDNFRQEVLESSLDLSNILVSDCTPFSEHEKNSLIFLSRESV